ncbi:MAG: aromatic acid decarboxylase [endosymbiont of Galathealinum brachiosum]|uniref:Flavin prenyltransferase UbiX n=1 Tax=endosymbiont of Galathealinum brachiosum TaxID=2200906 RepID=A0A370DB89_9GAMM|nr:MAG: aromatic acid decarboxylase [endosymbiont of Galathealinum brachiosum]
MNSNNKTIILAITGASGVQYGIRLLEQLLTHKHKVYLLVTRAAHVVISMETELSWPANNHELHDQLCKRYGVDDKQLKVCGESEWASPIASGSSSVDAMVVCPCSMGTLSSIAVGASANLLERAADVVLKERKNLILVPRETPFSDIHLENMLKLSRMGAVMLSANPGFYNKPQTVEDIVDFMVARVLDHLGVKQDLLPRWGE